MANVNKVILIGNLTRDPEVRFTSGGTPFAKFGLAVNRKFKDKSGEGRDETTFVDLEAWGKTAELAGQYLEKGRPVYIEGRLRLDQWETQDGQKRSNLVVVIESMQFLGGGGESRQSSNSARQRNADTRPHNPRGDYVGNGRQRPPTGNYDATPPSDEIPF